MNNTQQAVRYLNYDDFSGNNLNTNCQINISAQEVSKGINVEVYINSQLVKTQNFSIGNLEGKEIEDHYSYISIDMDSITVDITK